MDHAPVMDTACRRGQASLEMTAALAGTVLLLLGTLAIFLWMNGHIVRRQENYEDDRPRAASVPQPNEEHPHIISWDETRWNEPTQTLRIFRKD